MLLSTDPRIFQPMISLVSIPLIVFITCNKRDARSRDSLESVTMAALPVGMQLVTALDDVDFDDLDPIGNKLSTASGHMRHVMQLPLKSYDAATGRRDEH